MGQSQSSNLSTKPRRNASFQSGTNTYRHKDLAHVQSVIDANVVVTPRKQNKTQQQTQAHVAVRPPTSISTTTRRCTSESQLQNPQREKTQERTPVRARSQSAQKSLQHISERSPRRLQRSVSSFYGGSVSGSFLDATTTPPPSSGQVHSADVLSSSIPSTSSSSGGVGSDNTKRGSISSNKSVLKGGFKDVLQSNSCSTLFIDQTITRLDRETVLQNIARALHGQFEVVLGLLQAGKPLPEFDDIFDEKKHPLTSRKTVPADYATRLPSEEEIYTFLRCFFKAAVLEGEVALVSMVYITRLQQETRVVLMPANWKWIVIGCVLAAAKVWDDMAVWVNDFKTVLPSCSLEHFNKLERHILRKLRFDVSVSPREYAEHYFDLRRYGTPPQEISAQGKDSSKSALDVRATRKLGVGGVSPFQQYGEMEDDADAAFKRHASFDGVSERLAVFANQIVS